MKLGGSSQNERVLSRPAPELRKKGKFALWQEKNLGGSFKKFYVEAALKAIPERQAARALGADLPPRRMRMRCEWSSFSSQGLQRDHVVVDYGCGTLRLERH